MTTQERVQEHYENALKFLPEKRIVGIFLQGSQNYHVDTEFSDVDTKLILLPSFEHIAFNVRPVSTTWVLENNEHTDLKDLRLMFNTFRKQNINFLETLFTEYFILNPDYADEWNKLVENREMIAHYNKYVAVRTMRGMAEEKYKNLDRFFPAREEILTKFGYDPKQLHHLLRVEDFMERYIAGEKYKQCLIPKDPEYLKSVKLGLYTHEDALKESRRALDHIYEISSHITPESEWNVSNLDVDKLLNDVQLNAMRKAILE